MSGKEARIDELRKKLSSLAEEINAGKARIKLHQQTKVRGNMSFSGGNGRIWVTPCSYGYDISLSGQSLQKQMYGFMKERVGRECDGFKQRNKDIKNQPFWRVREFEIVHQAVIRYSETSL